VHIVYRLPINCERPYFHDHGPPYWRTGPHTHRFGGASAPTSPPCLRPCMCLNHMTDIYNGIWQTHSSKVSLFGGNRRMVRGYACPYFFSFTAREFKGGEGWGGEASYPTFRSKVTPMTLIYTPCGPCTLQLIHALQLAE
jgi:hypothetical protein